MNKSNAWQMEVYWITDKDKVYNASKKSAKIPIKTNMDEYETWYIDLSQYPGWKDNITQIRIDGIDDANQGYILYDSIEIIEKGSENKWTFDNDIQGWEATNKMITQQNDDKLVCNISGTDAYMTKKGLSVPLSKYNAVKIRYKNTTNSTSLQLFYTTNANPAFKGQFKNFIVKSNMTEYEELVLNMSDAVKWADVLTQLRFDPADTATTGVFYFDSIELVNVK